MIVSHFIEVAVILALRVLLSTENQRRDRVQSEREGGLDGRDLAATAFADLTDRENLKYALFTLLFVYHCHCTCCNFWWQMLTSVWTYAASDTFIERSIGALHDLLLRGSPKSQVCNFLSPVSGKGEVRGGRGEVTLVSQAMTQWNSLDTHWKFNKG